MDYKKWLKGIDTTNPDEVVEEILTICEKDFSSEQKLYAIQLLVHDSALVYNNELKNRIAAMKKKRSENTPEKSKGKRIVVMVKK